MYQRGGGGVGRMHLDLRSRHERNATVAAVALSGVALVTAGAALWSIHEKLRRRAKAVRSAGSSGSDYVCVSGPVRPLESCGALVGPYSGEACVAYRTEKKRVVEDMVEVRKKKKQTRGRNGERVEESSVKAPVYSQSEQLLEAHEDQCCNIRIGEVPVDLAGEKLGGMWYLTMNETWNEFVEPTGASKRTIGYRVLEYNLPVNKVLYAYGQLRNGMLQRPLDSRPFLISELGPYPLSERMEDESKYTMIGSMVMFFAGTTCFLSLLMI